MGDGLSCAQCAADHKGNFEKEFPSGPASEAVYLAFQERYPFRAPVTMINGTLMCLMHLPAVSQAKLTLLAPGSVHGR